MASIRQIEQRKNAGKASGESRRKRPPSALLNIEAPIPEASIDVKTSMEAYTKLVGPPTNWSEVKLAVQTEGEIQKNVIGAMELASRAKRQWSSDQVQSREAAISKVVMDRNDLVERMLDEIDGITPGQRRQFLDLARAWRIESSRCMESAHG